MSFIPEQPKGAQQTVPFFGDVTSEQGWCGHSTGKSVDTLKGEIIAAISRLGGLVVGFQPGDFMIDGQDRQGFQIHYVIEQAGGKVQTGKIDVAALPVRQDENLRRSLETRKKKALKMALFMLRESLDGTWFLHVLSPGYAPLMPWMIESKTGKTISQLWTEQTTAQTLLTAGQAGVIDGQFTELTSEPKGE